jgi:hypothetical protein
MSADGAALPTARDVRACYHELGLVAIGQQARVTKCRPCSSPDRHVAVKTYRPGIQDAYGLLNEIAFLK